MKIAFNCCPKPLTFKHSQGMTLFKGEAPSNEVKSEVKPDTFEKKSACKVCEDCCKKGEGKDD